jgi:hypothetical protein
MTIFKINIFFHRTKQKKVTAASDMTQTTSALHNSRTEDCIEVSQSTDNVDKSKKTVIINLPNSIASMPQMYTPSITNNSSVMYGKFDKESFKVSIAAEQGTQSSLFSSAAPTNQQTTAVSFRVHDVVAVSLADDSPKMAAFQRKDEVKSCKTNSLQKTNGGQGTTNKVSY